MTAFCTKCGSALSTTTRYCTNCGTENLIDTNQDMTPAGVAAVEQHTDVSKTERSYSRT